MHSGTLANPLDGSPAVGFAALLPGVIGTLANPLDGSPAVGVAALLPSVGFAALLPGVDFAALLDMPTCSTDMATSYEAT